MGPPAFYFQHHVSLVLWTNRMLPGTGGSSSCPGGATPTLELELPVSAFSLQYGLFLTFRKITLFYLITMSETCADFVHLLKISLLGLVLLVMVTLMSTCSTLRSHCTVACEWVTNPVGLDVPGNGQGSLPHHVYCSE